MIVQKGMCKGCDKVRLIDYELKLCCDCNKSHEIEKSIIEKSIIEWKKVSFSTAFELFYEFYKIKCEVKEYSEIISNEYCINADMTYGDINKINISFDQIKNGMWYVEL